MLCILANYKHFPVQELFLDMPCMKKVCTTNGVSPLVSSWE